MLCFGNPRLLLEHSLLAIGARLGCTCRKTRAMYVLKDAVLAFRRFAAKALVPDFTIAAPRLRHKPCK